MLILINFVAYKNSITLYFSMYWSIKYVYLKVWLNKFVFYLFINHLQNTPKLHYGGPI